MNKKDIQDDDQVIDVESISVVEKDIEILPDDLENRIKIIKKQNNALMMIMDELLELNIDYGIVPGVDKPFLWKTGAQQLGLVFKLRPVFTIISPEIDWNKDPIFVKYEVKCQIFNKETGVFLGEGMGACNNYERKYKYYWEYPENGEKYRAVFEDPLDKQNTLLKMAEKRAQVNAVLTVTGASRLFTQDDDLVPPQNNKGKGKNRKVEALDDPGEYIVPFGFSKGEKLKDVNDSTLKWASGLNPSNKQGAELKANALKFLEIKNGNGKNNNGSSDNNNEAAKSNETTTKRELTDREKEIEEIIGDNKESKKDLYDYLSYFKVKKIDDLSDGQYEDLKNLLKQINSSNFDPGNISLPFE